MKFVLRFPESKLEKWQRGDLTSLQRIGEDAKNRGYLTREEFLKICADKSSRSKSRCASNSTELIREVTEISFSAKAEQVQIQSLMILVGVSWPTASYILHFCSANRYPVLDFRALWSLSINKPPLYTFSFWHEYTDYCRNLADRSGLTMRQVDAALWQYSKENQKPA
jgi:hypothetical protein